MRWPQVRNIEARPAYPSARVSDLRTAFGGLVAFAMIAGCSQATAHMRSSSGAPVLPTLEAGVHMESTIYSGHGSATLGTFIPDGPIEVRWACVGPDITWTLIQAGGMVDIGDVACDGVLHVGQEPSVCKVPTTLRVAAAASARWSFEVVSTTTGYTRELCNPPTPSS